MTKIIMVELAATVKKSIFYFISVQFTRQADKTHSIESWHYWPLKSEKSFKVKPFNVNMDEKGFKL